ncbi:MAG: glycosyltransferase [Scytolyngbya sp. HA4215-MV1]|jgi:glycosyltransferase involved in cell wall biosynthesis|nr:glycosyltransferase [Scytolyngbya sp. HA4215-MV1]
MRTLYFLLPGTDGKFACGGLWAELKTLALAKQFCQAELVTYRQREKDTLFLDDILQKEDCLDVIFVVSWGFDVPKLVARLKSHCVVYHAHSARYGFYLPARIPIVTVSRHTLGYWGQYAANSLIYYLPNQISDEFYNFHQERDIDVLLQTRKSSHYLMQDLVPALQKQCNVKVIDSYIQDLPALFNRTKVYLYDSAEYWAIQGVSEGFGLQPLEAIACGCQVFSSVNDGLADYLDPGFNCHKIAGYSQEYDVQRILHVLNHPQSQIAPQSHFTEYRIAHILDRFPIILQELNEFFDHQQHHPNNIPQLTQWRIAKLRIQRILNKLEKKFKLF